MKIDPTIQNALALRQAETPRFVRAMTRWLGILFFAVPAAMLFLPWQQNIIALGSVTAFVPVERQQSVDAPVAGLIRKWHVREGSHVKEGDPLLEISDIDPQFTERLKAQLEANELKLEAKEEELNAYEVQLQNLLVVRDSRITAAQYKLDVARQKVVTASESIAAAQATLDAAAFQIQRLQRLLDEGLVSRRDLELATRDEIVARRALNSAKAQYDSSKAEEKSAVAELQQVRADAQSSIDATHALINKIKGEVADSRNALTTAEINLSRQQAQLVYAPRAGTVQRITVNSQSQVISRGQPLLVIVPVTNQRAVELMVDGRDAALILPGAPVRLEFEGWPAAQIAGWPDISVGTFAGKVAFVDPVDDGTGNFRVMVLPDESEQDWPSPRFLRQGSSAKGWILLEEVMVGYEVWRILNGFPPRIPKESGKQAATTEGWG
ncbi:MAG TPA: HlyD family efflux transporter periplasmic adaptor subunit [Methylophilaceae bacterium]|nr:HlyD family efflux transporter periplasmic adaptor subunit [Methylophilaceae bacterium]